MTGCHGLRGGFPLPQRMPFPPSVATLASLLPTLSSILFPHLPFLLSLPSNPVEKTNQPGPSCAACYTYCPAGIHCLQLVPRHVFDSMPTCIRANLLVHFCRRAHVCQGANVCTHLGINTFSAHFMISRKSGSLGKTIEGHRSEQVQLLRTIHQYAGQILEQAQQKNMAKK